MTISLVIFLTIINTFSNYSVPVASKLVHQSDSVNQRFSQFTRSTLRQVLVVYPSPIWAHSMTKLDYSFK